MLFINYFSRCACVSLWSQLSIEFPSVQNIHCRIQTHVPILPFYVLERVMRKFCLQGDKPHGEREGFLGRIFFWCSLIISDQHCLLPDPATLGSSCLPHISQLCHLHYYTVKTYRQRERERERDLYFVLSSFLLHHMAHIKDVFYSLFFIILFPRGRFQSRKRKCEFSSQFFGNLKWHWPSPKKKCRKCPYFLSLKLI